MPTTCTKSTAASTATWSSSISVRSRRDTSGLIRQPDRSGWQRRAAGELVIILTGHPELPVIAWTVTASGGALSGQVLVSAAGRRGLFGQWRRALGLDEVTEIPCRNG